MYNTNVLTKSVTLYISQKGSSYGEARKASSSLSLQQSTGKGQFVSANRAQILFVETTVYTQGISLSITSTRNGGAEVTRHSRGF